MNRSPFNNVYLFSVKTYLSGCWFEKNAKNIISENVNTQMFKILSVLQEFRIIFDQKRSK